MKKYVTQVSLILLALTVVAATIYLAPRVTTIFPNASYRFVLFFLLLILMSNILAKIVYKYFET